MTLSQSKLALLVGIIVAASAGTARAEDPQPFAPFGFLNSFKPSKPAAGLARVDSESQPPELLPAPRPESDAKCSAPEKCQAAAGCPAIIVINTTPSLLQVVGEWLFSYFFMGDEDDGPEPPAAPVAPAPAFVEGCQMHNPFDFWPTDAMSAAKGYPRNSSESVSGFLISLPYMLLPGFGVQAVGPVPGRGSNASSDLPMTMPYIIQSQPILSGNPYSEPASIAPSTTRLLSGAEIASLPPPVPVFAPFGHSERPSYVAESLPPQLPLVTWSQGSNVPYPNQGLVYQAVASLPAPVNPSRAPCLMKAERDGDQYVVAAQRGGMSMLCTKVTLEMGEACRLQVGAANHRIVLASKQFEAVADMVEAQEEEGRLVLVGRATLLYKKNGEPCRVEADKIMLDVTKAGLDFRATSTGR